MSVPFIHNTMHHHRAEACCERCGRYDGLVLRDGVFVCWPRCVDWDELAKVVGA